MGATESLVACLLHGEELFATLGDQLVLGQRLGFPANALDIRLYRALDICSRNGYFLCAKLVVPNPFDDDSAPDSYQDSRPHVDKVLAMADEARAHGADADQVDAIVCRARWEQAVYERT